MDKGKTITAIKFITFTDFCWLFFLCFFLFCMLFLTVTKKIMTWTARHQAFLLSFLWFSFPVARNFPIYFAASVASIFLPVKALLFCSHHLNIILPFPQVEHLYLVLTKYFATSYCLWTFPANLNLSRTLTFKYLQNTFHSAKAQLLIKKKCLILLKKRSIGTIDYNIKILFFTKTITWIPAKCGRNYCIQTWVKNKR